MSKFIESLGKIKAGKLFISYRERFDDALAYWPDCQIKIRVERVYRKRSLDQNAYYHSVICNCFLQGVKAEWGEDHSKDWAHEELKKHCNYSEKLVPSTGELIQLSQSTKKLTTTEFMEYQDRCIKLIAEWFGITVPEPGEQTKLF